MKRLWAWAKAALGALVSLTAIWLGLEGSSLYNDLPWHFKDHTWIAHGAFVCLAFNGMWLTGVRLHANLATIKKKEDRAFDEQAHGVLVTLLRDLVRLHSPVFHTVCVNVFIVEPRKGHLVQRKRADIRLGDPRANGIEWTRGKGVIGLCWDTGEDQRKDLDKLYWKVRSKPSEKAWLKLPEEDRMGLSYEDFKKVKNVSYVAASPIIGADGECLGCVSIDGSPDLEQSFSSWDQLLKDAASEVARILAVSK